MRGTIIKCTCLLAFGVAFTAASAYGFRTLLVTKPPLRESFHNPTSIIAYVHSQPARRILVTATVQCGSHIRHDRRSVQSGSSGRLSLPADHTGLCTLSARASAPTRRLWLRVAMH